MLCKNSIFVLIISFFIWEIAFAEDKTELQIKIEEVSESLLGTPYLLDALGEGKDAEYDQDPLYRFDGLDCTTFVETVTAIALASDHNDAYYDPGIFLNILTRLRYKDGVVGFTNRNHFPETDWIPNNKRAGFFKDITKEIAPSLTKTAKALIDKKSWYEHLELNQIRDPEMSDEEKSQRLQKLHDEGKNYKIKRSRLTYVPFETVLEVMDKIPSGTIVNMVAPHWEIKDHDGHRITELSVGHQGFIIQKDGNTLLRHASQRHTGNVQEEPFSDFIDYYLYSPKATKPLKGANFLRILPNH